LGYLRGEFTLPAAPSSTRKISNLPPIYIKHTEKQRYYDALALADSKGDYQELSKIIIRELIRTMMEINKGYGR